MKPNVDGYLMETEDEKHWFENEVLVGNGTLILHSNEVGDEVGIVTSVKNIQYMNKTIV
jgi:hypothetical protein